MKGFFTFLFILFVSSGYSQRWHINLFGGVANYQGDLQEKFFTFNQSQLSGGGGFTYDITNHLSARLAVTFGKISGADKYTSNKERNLSFSSGITEGKLDAVYNIFPEGSHSLTPYVWCCGFSF